MKIVQKARFPIVGFIPDVGGIAALYLGRQDGKELVYAGKVGSGFSHKTSMAVRKKLNALVTPATEADAENAQAEGNSGSNRGVFISSKSTYRDITC